MDTTYNKGQGLEGDTVIVGSFINDYGEVVYIYAGNPDKPILQPFKHRPSKSFQPFLY